jgi:penicillin-binding protein-related factor A (putative recombinase)
LTGDLWYWKVSDKFTSGIPDFVGVYKGRFFAIELKKEGLRARIGDKFGLARILQAVILRKIEKAGGLCLATDNIEDVRKLLNF